MLALEKHSGERGLFASIWTDPKHRTVHPEFCWLPPEQGEAHDTYVTRAQSLMQGRSQALCFRKGLGSDLGYLRKDSDAREPKMRFVEISGVPRTWQAEELSELLESQTWTNISLQAQEQTAGVDRQWFATSNCCSKCMAL